jgi:hypothetical protein
MSPRRIRPLGQPTRGKTALNRLRQVDVYIALAYPAVLSSGDPLVIDVGYGAYPWTTLEMRDRWLPVNPRLRVLGIEIDADRVAAALPYADPPSIDFRLGGFNVHNLIGSARARLIRAYNVLRQYDESEVSAALDALGAGLEQGGLLIEGTSTPTGHLVAFDVYQKTELTVEHREIVFGTNFRAALDPEDFQTILPKRLIHHMLDEQPQQFFACWRQSVTVARGRGQTQRRQVWIAAARLLVEQFGYPIDVRRRILSRGYLAVRSRFA